MTKQIKHISGEGIDTKEESRNWKPQREHLTDAISNIIDKKDADYAQLQSDHKALPEKYEKLEKAFEELLKYTYEYNSEYLKKKMFLEWRKRAGLSDK